MRGKVCASKVDGRLSEPLSLMYLVFPGAVLLDEMERSQLCDIGRWSIYALGPLRIVAHDNTCAPLSDSGATLHDYV